MSLNLSLFSVFSHFLLYKGSSCCSFYWWEETKLSNTSKRVISLFCNPINCNNLVRSAERLLQSDNHIEAYGGSRSSRMTYFCGNSYNPACKFALGQQNKLKETSHLSRNVGFWGHAAVVCGIFSLPAIYSQAGQLLLPIQNGLAIWAFIFKGGSVQRQRNWLLRSSQWSSKSQIWNLNGSIPICSRWIKKAESSKVTKRFQVLIFH